MKKPRFARDNKLSLKQYDLICDIQRATYEKDTDFLICLPFEVVRVAKIAQKFYNQRNDETGRKYDVELANLVKKYWDKKGIAISQEVAS